MYLGICFVVYDDVWAKTPQINFDSRLTRMPALATWYLLTYIRSSTHMS
jgi:hypothetical protein